MSAPWQEELRRCARHRRASVLHGNVADQVSLAPDQPDVDLALFAATTLTAGDGPHRCAVIADPDGRLRFPAGQDRAFARLWGEAGEAADDAGDAYDVGPRRDATVPAAIPPVELLAFAERLAARGRGELVLVLDRMDLMATDPSRLAEEERRWTLAFARAVQAGDASRAVPHIVLITRRLGGLPPVVYQQDARVHLITVPRPSRSERLAFFERQAHALRLQPTAPRPGERRPERVILAEALVDLTDDLTRVDLHQLAALSRTTPAPMPADSLLNLYRYGEARSPWEELSEAKVRGVEAALAERVVGQEEAIAHVAGMVRRAWLGLSGLQHSAQGSSPKGRLFFVGPTGVGKTELAKALAAFLFGDERACLRFDMSEFNHEHSDQRLVGAPPGYVGFEEGGQLTNAVRARPFSVLLFDEIEKAHPRILDKFLQILEDGRLTDGRGETTWFGETVIIFTSNLGAATTPEDPSPAGRRQHFVQAVEQHFVHQLGRPELLNRLGDNIVPFGPVLDAGVRGQLLRRKLRPVVEHLKRRFGVALRVEPAAEVLLVRQARAAHGGRGLINAIERVLLDALACLLVERHHQLREGRVIRAFDDAGVLGLELIDG